MPASMRVGFRRAERASLVCHAHPPNSPDPPTHCTSHDIHPHPQTPRTPRLPSDVLRRLQGRRGAARTLYSLVFGRGDAHTPGAAPHPPPAAAAAGAQRAYRGPWGGAAGCGGGGGFNRRGAVSCWARAGQGVAPLPAPPQHVRADHHEVLRLLGRMIGEGVARWVGGCHMG